MAKRMNGVTYMLPLQRQQEVQDLRLERVANRRHISIKPRPHGLQSFHRLERVASEEITAHGRQQACHVCGNEHVVGEQVWNSLVDSGHLHVKKRNKKEIKM